MSQNKSICDTKPLFMLGLRNDKDGLTLGIPLVYDGLLADHVLHTSDGSSHPSQLVVSDFKNKTSSLITGENAPFLSEIPNILVKTGQGQRQGKAGLLTKLNPEKVKILKNKYRTITQSPRLNKFFIQSFSKSGNAPTVAQYSKIMKDIQSKKNKHFKEKADYASNTSPASFPDGMDVEVFSKKILQKEKFEHLIISGNPFNLFKFGFLLHKKFKIPWTADYRDAWSTSEINDKNLREKLSITLLTLTMRRPGVMLELS